MMTRTDLDNIRKAAVNFVGQVPTENDKVFFQGIEFALSAVRIAQLVEEAEAPKKTERRLQRGDRIKIYKPKDIQEGPGWVPACMDEYTSGAQIFNGYTPGGNIEISGTSLLFDPKWVVAEGDWVKVKMPLDRRSSQGIYWNGDMNKYDGQTIQVREIDERGAFVLDSWFFDLEWCTKVQKNK